jgi:D-apiose dehydrogenase
VRTVGRRIRVMVHENCRFRPWFRELKRSVQAGELGALVAARMATINSGFPPDASGRRPAFERQPFMQREERLMIAEVLIHHLDIMRYLCGEMRVVSASAFRTLPEVVGETIAAVAPEACSRVPVQIVDAMAAAGYSARTPDHLEIVGTTASATLQDDILRLLAVQPREIPLDSEDGCQASFDGVIAHFVSSLASGAAFKIDLTDNLETLRLVEHAYWAAGCYSNRLSGGAYECSKRSRRPYGGCA